MCRTLSQLENEQLVAQDVATRGYVLGVKVMEIGLIAQSQLDLRSASRPYLHQLRDETGETVSLSLRIGLERMFVDLVESKHEVRQIPEMGKRSPLWCGSGKAILAFLGESDSGAVMESLRSAGTQVLASGQILDAGRLREQLAQVRSQGFVVTVGERQPGVVGVAAPIFGREHQVLGAICVGGPLPRFGVEEATRFVAAVVGAAGRISLCLGDDRGKARSMGDEIAPDRDAVKGGVRAGHLP